MKHLELLARKMAIATGRPWKTMVQIIRRQAQAEGPPPGWDTEVPEAEAKAQLAAVRADPESFLRELRAIDPSLGGPVRH